MHMIKGILPTKSVVASMGCLGCPWLDTPWVLIFQEQVTQTTKSGDTPLHFTCKIVTTIRWANSGPVDTPMIWSRCRHCLLGAFSVIVQLAVIFGNLRLKLYWTLPGSRVRVIPGITFITLQHRAERNKHWLKYIFSMLSQTDILQLVALPFIDLWWRRGRS